MDFNITDHTILLSIVGSRSFGINTELSDFDFKGVIIPSKEYFLGFNHSFEQLEDNEAINKAFPILGRITKGIKSEGILYDIRKFFRLAAQCNPSIIEVLFTAPEHIIHCNHLGQDLLDIRERFLSAKAKFSFSGYAIAQLKRLRSHRKYLLNPPSHKPTREEFGLTVAPKIPKEQMEAAIHILNSGISTEELEERGSSTEFMQVIMKEKAYKSSMIEWKQYQNWIETRNPERAKLEAKCYYDAKHAAMLVRLLRVGKEILTTGKVIVDRRIAGDADEIRAIKTGDYLTYEQLVEYAEKMEKELDDIYNNKTYIVPHNPDLNFLDKKCLDIVAYSLHLEG